MGEPEIDFLRRRRPMKKPMISDRIPGRIQRIARLLIAVTLLLLSSHRSYSQIPAEGDHEVLS